MAYISGGEVLDSKQQSPWRLSYIPELFWGLINLIVIFFTSLVNPNANSKGSGHTTDYRLSGRGPDPFGPGGGPKRRMGGYRGGQGGPSSPPMGGGG